LLKKAAANRHSESTVIQLHMKLERQIQISKKREQALDGTFEEMQIQGQDDNLAHEQLNEGVPPSSEALLTRQ